MLLKFIFNSSIILFYTLLIIGCNSQHSKTIETEPSSNKKISEIDSIVNIKTTSEEEQKNNQFKIDEYNIEMKIGYLKAKNKISTAKDTQCAICLQRCCSPCLQDGDPLQCVETRFENCSKCNHSSNKHSSVDHL